MVKAYLDALDGQIEAIDDQETGLLSPTIFAGSWPWSAERGKQPEAIRVARLEDAKRYVSLLWRT